MQLASALAKHFRFRTAGERLSNVIGRSQLMELNLTECTQETL